MNIVQPPAFAEVPGISILAEIEIDPDATDGRFDLVHGLPSTPTKVVLLNPVGLIGLFQPSDSAKVYFKNFSFSDVAKCLAWVSV